MDRQLFKEQEVFSSPASSRYAQQVPVEWGEPEDKEVEWGEPQAEEIELSPSQGTAADGVAEVDAAETDDNVVYADGYWPEMSEANEPMPAMQSLPEELVRPSSRMPLWQLVPEAACAPSGCGSPFIGVNLGGWLVLEDYMCHDVFKSSDSEDEWSLIREHGGPQSSEAIRMMHWHWNSFVTKEHIDQLHSMGITHVRVPLGWWLVDHDPADGYVFGGEAYLRRLLSWLQPRGMKALLELHALPCAQTPGQSFTGRKNSTAGFFLSRACHERGQRAILRLAELVHGYDLRESTKGTVMGMGFVNEPSPDFLEGPMGILALYTTLVPLVRKRLPSERYALFLSFMGSLDRATDSAAWLAERRDRDPENFFGVIYEAHIYHAFGDNDKDEVTKHSWTPEVDLCKTCCRDPQLLSPVAQRHLPLVVGEYSASTGPWAAPGAWFVREFLQDQLSLWASTPGMVGSFFWNHHIQTDPDSLNFVEMSLLDLRRNIPLPQLSSLPLEHRCPGRNLSRCPKFHERTVRRTSSCHWEH